MLEFQLSSILRMYTWIYEKLVVLYLRTNAANLLDIRLIIKKYFSNCWTGVQNMHTPKHHETTYLFKGFIYICCNKPGSWPGKIGSKFLKDFLFLLTSLFHFVLIWAINSLWPNDAILPHQHCCLVAHSLNLRLDKYKPEAVLLTWIICFVP